MKNRLEHEMESTGDTHDNITEGLQATNLFERLKAAERSENEANQDNSKIQSHRKSVKFELPRNDSKESVKKELQELKVLIRDITRRQSELEARLSKLEEGQE